MKRKGAGMKKPRVTLDMSPAAVANADALAALTGQSRTKAVSDLLETLDPRQTARGFFERKLNGDRA